MSVAVSTYDRRASLLRLLAALEAQTLAPDRFEVVIADNGSRDGSAEELAEYAAKTPLRITVVTLERNQGPAGGRNAAWRAALGEVVAFTDDDCVPAEDWLERGLEVMSADHRTVAVGRTLPDPDDAHLLARPFTRVVRIDDASFYATCNVFYRRADLDLVGGFDEAFATPAGEDTDLGLRVSEAGRTTVFVPDAVVHHPVRPSSFRATVRETVRWVGIPRVIARHPAARSLLVHRLFWKRSHPPTLFAVLGVLLVLRRRRAAVLLLPWLWHRLVTAPPCPGPRRRVLALPGTFAVDALEVAVMVRGSVRERTLVL